MKHRFIYCLLFLILLLASCGHDTNKVIVNSTVKDPEKTLPSGSSPHSPLEPAEYKGMNYLDVESLLQQAGFEKILLSPIEDIDSNSDIQDGTVELVQINNSDDYTSKTEFDKDDTVTVVYHNIPKIQAPLSSDDAGPRPYMETGKMFFEAGFKDVETDEVYDLAAGEAGYAILTAGGNLIEKDAQLPFDSSISVIGHYPVSEYPVTVSIDFVSNLIFSKYDVVVSLDGNKLGKLPHGEDAVYNLSLPAGNYSLVFTSAKDSNVVGTADLSVNSGTQTEYKISCYSKEISVKNTMFVQDLTEGKIMMPFNDWHYLRKDVKSVENELKSLGLQHVKTEATNDFYWPQDRINSVVKVEIGQKTEFKHDDLFDASASVTVYYHTANFAFKESLIHVTEKDTFEIPYTLTSGDSVDALEFEIDHPDVLKRNADGTYTALIPGEATVTAYCGGDQYSECKVEVAEIIVPVEKLVFPSDDLNVSVGKVFKPEYRIVPENANYTEIRAEISTDLIEITDDLAFYANEAGNSVISFYQEDRLLGSLNVHAVFYEIEDLVMEETADELFIGDTLILKYTLFPEEATNKGVTVASSNSEIAEVEFDERGASEVKVTGKTAGEADITILLPNGNAYTHTVTVKEVEPEEIILTMVDANQRV
ncbi:MAG: Ig-like domain-containing protein, partial [Solobacterium sp.]|nr:Ig-like domain-containing protein [Solobacterium sp.]